MDRQEQITIIYKVGAEKVHLSHTLNDHGRWLWWFRWHAQQAGIRSNHKKRSWRAQLAQTTKQYVFFDRIQIAILPACVSLC